MKKLILISLMIFSGYKLYQHFSSAHDIGPVAADGTPIAQLFIGPNCDQLCNEMEALLINRHINYELIDVSTPEGKKFDIPQYPLTKVGKQKVIGNNRNQLIAVLAEAYGESVLTPGERMAMSGHFDEDGKPMVVLYGTKWCGYCKREREYLADHDIPFYDLDVESSPSAKLSYDTLQGGGYPLIFVGYRRFDGYKEREVLNAIAELRKG